VTVPGIPVAFSATPGTVRHLPTDDRVVSAEQLWRDARNPPNHDHERLAPSPEEEPAQLALAGLRVIDLCTFLARPMASALLADHGADIVKAEGPTGDAYRVYSLPYLMVNQRKRAVALDLRRPEGRAALLDIRPRPPPPGGPSGAPRHRAWRRRARRQPATVQPGAARAWA
jgi:hypothetical protein